MDEAAAGAHGWDQGQVLSSKLYAKQTVLRMIEEAPAMYRDLVELTPESSIVPYRSYVGDLVASMANGRGSKHGGERVPDAVH